MANFKKPGSSDLNKAFHKAAPYLNIGYVLTGSVIFFAVAGNWVDKKFDHQPLFLIIGVFVGLILGFYNMIKVIQELERK
ncbi:MAG: AtpZ/AtpI family protein [Calditrichaceae bacterium]